MLKREDIKNNNIVFHTDDKNYYFIKDVGNAVESGDRVNSMVSRDDELSYSLVDILTGKVMCGVCEHSGMSTCLNVATTKDVEIYLATLEADAYVKLGEAKKEITNISNAINHFVNTFLK